MKEILVTRSSLHDLMYEAMVRAGGSLPADVKKALNEALSREQEEVAQLHLSATLENLKVAEENGRLACADTGFPLYYVKIGDNVKIEGGFSTLYEVAREAVAQATKNAKLRPTMVHPLKRTNPGTNVGPFLPKVEIKFDSTLDGLEITAVPKGGGSEIFGTFYKMLVPADGKEGMLKFILDCAVKATYAGKVCPPTVIGVGIGGSADICMKLAKEAAVLRPIGNRHPEPEIAGLEEELLEAINSLGLGAMGCRGAITALDVHIEYAVTHTAALPVAFNAQCSICRRATATLKSNGVIEYSGENSGWRY